MTTGIYLLEFTGTDKVYIGQSVNIEKRFINHKSDMANNRSAIKLQEAYTTYGSPILHILKICSILELNGLEEYLITEFNSISHGFNYVKGGSNAVGENNPMAKYSVDTYISILEYLVETTISSNEIAYLTNSTPSIVKHISALDRHEWLAEVCPTLYSDLVNLRSMGNKKCAVSQGLKYPKIVSPEGSTFEVFNITKFCKEHKLSSGAVCSMLNGKSYTHKGWYVEGFQKPQYPKLISPDGVIYEIPYRGIKPFAREHNLHSSSISDLLKGLLKTTKGWKLA